MVLWWQLPENELPALTFSGGAGTESDPYLISNATDLNRIGHNGRLMAAHFRLINDIDLGGVDFFCIGNRGYNYSGVFNGNGHTISNFTYSSTGRNNVGLFGGIRGEDAEVRDLGLINPDVNAGTGSVVGSLVGRNSGTITNCYVDGAGVAGTGGVGGLVGSNTGTITDCHSSGIVLSTGYGAGGLVGENRGTISKCYSTGRVWGYLAVGGLAGGSVGRVTNSYATGSVSGESYVGGLVGSGWGTISNCYSTGSVSGIGIVGGLVGEHGGTITDCYSTGSVTGIDWVGGLIGDNQGTASSSFWDTETSGRINMCGSASGSGCDDGNGKTTAQMQTASTFSSAGWDFVGETINGTEDIWRLCNAGAEYPQLSWQYLLGDFVCPDGVDWSDLAVLCEQWLQVGAYSADIGPARAGDGIVNFPDFAALADNWLTGL